MAALLPATIRALSSDFKLQFLDLRVGALRAPSLQEDTTMSIADTTIVPHHEAAARMWGQGGRHYDDVSFAISDALAHAAQRLNAGEGQRILDVATGTGWSARNVARMGAAVTGVDISEELLAAACLLSGHIRPAIAFREGDAERLPFEERAFDGIISTFGVMFARDQAK